MTKVLALIVLLATMAVATKAACLPVAGDTPCADGEKCCESLGCIPESEICPDDGEELNGEYSGGGESSA